MAHNLNVLGSNPSPANVGIQWAPQKPSERSTDATIKRGSVTKADRIGLQIFFQPVQLVYNAVARCPSISHSPRNASIVLSLSCTKEYAATRRQPRFRALKVQPALVVAATTMAPTAAMHTAHAAKPMHATHAAKRHLATTEVTPVKPHMATVEHVIMGAVEMATIEVVMIKAAANGALTSYFKPVTPHKFRCRTRRFWYRFSLQSQNKRGKNNAYESWKHSRASAKGADRG